MGGLSKKAWQFERILANGKQPFVKVDGGGLLFQPRRLEDFKLQQLQTTVAGIVQAYNRMGYDAVGVSGGDLAAGLDFLRQTARDSQFVWLSANLVFTADDSPVFTPYISRDIAGIRIAIVGLTSGNVAENILAAGKATLRPWAEVLPGLLPDISLRHDFVILLSDYTVAQCAEIGRRYPAINLIIAADGQTENLPPRLINPTSILVSTGKQGKYIGSLGVSWSPGGAWGEGDNVVGELSRKNAAVQKTCGQIESLKGRRGMESLVGNLERKKAVLLADIVELDKKRSKTLVSYFANKFYALGSDVSDDPGVEAIVEATKERINKLAGEAGLDNVRPVGFVGWRVCVACHKDNGKKWQRSAHAQAYATLVAKKQEFNYNCVPCHVTGINSDNISQSLAVSAEFHDVGCESCHGPGQAHVEGKGHIDLAAVVADICLRCHVPEHDDGFDFNADLRKIGCPSNEDI